MSDRIGLLTQHRHQPLHSPRSKRLRHCIDQDRRDRSFIRFRNLVQELVQAFGTTPVWLSKSR